MTPRNRLLKTLRHEEPDRVPLHYQTNDPAVVRLTRELLGNKADTCLSGDSDTIMFRKTKNDAAFLAWHRKLPSGSTVDNWGVGRLMPAEAAGGDTYYGKEFHPLSEIEALHELEAFPFPDLREGWRHEHLESEVRKIHAADRAAVGNMSQTILETAFRMRGMENLFIDFSVNPDLAARLFDKLTDQRVFQARRFAEAGVDVLRIGDDIADQRSTLVSPDMYRKWLKPRHAAIIGTARELRPDIPVLYHSDGNIEGILNDLIEIGVTSVNPIQPECMDVPRIKKDYGDRITLWGTVSTQAVIAEGDRDDVRNMVVDRMKTAAPGGGFVFDLINVAYNERARRNVTYFLEAVIDLGWY